MFLPHFGMTSTKYVFDVVLCTANNQRIGYRLHATTAAEAATKAMNSAMCRRPSIRPASLQLVELRRLRAVRRNRRREQAARGALSAALMTHAVHTGPTFLSLPGLP